MRRIFPRMLLDPVLSLKEQPFETPFGRKLRWLLPCFLACLGRIAQGFRHLASLLSAFPTQKYFTSASQIVALWVPAALPVHLWNNSVKQRKGNDRTRMHFSSPTYMTKSRKCKIPETLLKQNRKNPSGRGKVVYLNLNVTCYCPG